MRVIFMGNPEFALPTLHQLIDSHHEVIAVVSNPPKPIGRGRKLRYTAVGQYAQDHSIKLIEPDSLKSKELHNELSALNPDIFVVVAYRILPQTLISLPKFGSVNLHASLLPKYRGAGPIQWALMNGDETTGVTVFQIEKKVDTGDILKQKQMTINADDNMVTLGTRLCTEGATLVVDALDEIESGTINPISQRDLSSSPAPKISKDMTTINWTWPAEKIHNWVRGLSPFPGMSTLWNGKRIRIFSTRVIHETSTESPGKVVKTTQNEIFVNTQKHLLAFSEIQLEGKKRMRVFEFLIGNKLNAGDELSL